MFVYRFGVITPLKLQAIFSLLKSLSNQNRIGIFSVASVTGGSNFILFSVIALFIQFNAQTVNQTIYNNKMA